MWTPARSLGIIRRRRQVALSLQFASRDDLAAMAGDGARLVAAASAGDTQRVDALLASRAGVQNRHTVWWSRVMPGLQQASQPLRC